MRARTWSWLLLLLTGCAGAPELLPTAGLSVSFTGTRELGFRLRRVIEDLLIDFERAPQSDVPLFDAALDLQDWFVDQGYPEAKVSYRARREPELGVVFDIDEGPRVTIARLEFHGNEAYSGAELRALWSRTASGQFGLGDPLFVAADIEALRLAVLEHYDAHGYLDATCTPAQIDRAPGNARARVDFTLVEGPLYRFGSVDIADDLPLAPAQLGSGALSGRRFDRTVAATIGMRARTELLHTGYPEPRVDLEVTPDRDTHTVALRLTGQPGPRTTVAKVLIAGNERTAEYVIRRHVHVVDDRLFDGQAVEQTTSDLYRTGLFRRVDIERKPHADDDQVVDLTVRVDEADAHDLDLLAGYGSYETLRGGIFWTDRNLLGLGQRLQLGARASIRGEGLTASWSEPHLFSSDTSLTIGGHARMRQEPAFLDTSRGLDIALGRDLVGPLRGRLGYALQSRNGSDIDPTLSSSADTRYEIGSAFVELLIDRRDSPLYPSHGHRLGLKLEHAGQGVGGNVDLDRVTWSSSYFLSLADNVVAGVSARTGVIWPHASGLIPLQERFFNGGESSVRSFRESKLGPLSVDGTPTGGAFFNTLNVELRFPIAATLHGAVFADAGNVGSDADAFALSRLRWGFGGGLRLVLPIGPVRLDGAGNPSPDPGEDRWTLHFSVGLPF